MRGVIASFSKETLIGLAAASERFRAIAEHLRQQPGITSVHSTCWLATGSSGGAVSAEWYTDGEFDNGRAIDFGLELAWAAGEWTLAPAIRVTHGEGQDDLIDLPTSKVFDDDVLRELSVVCELLVTAQEQAVEAFREWQASLPFLSGCAGSGDRAVVPPVPARAGHGRRGRAPASCLGS